MRLIDADKLYPDCLTKQGKFAISQSQIANAPTVEREPFATVTFDKDELDRIVDERVIEPIKNGELVIKEERPQGEWIEYTDRITLDTYYECSNCKEPWATIEGTPWQNMMNFCPNYGADMRGKDNQLRDCENCIHHSDNGCEVWECEFEKRSE